MNIHKHARMTSHGRLLLVQRIRLQGWRAAEAAAASGENDPKLKRLSCGSQKM